MITREQYFGWKLQHPDATRARIDNSTELLMMVNGLLEHAKVNGGYTELIDPDTGTQISGSRGGAGDGGFRISTATTGATDSKHKQGAAVDVFDPNNQLDSWLTDEILAKFNLYREHPDSTPGWCHVQIIPPNSKRRTYTIK